MRKSTILLIAIWTSCLIILVSFAITIFGKVVHEAKNAAININYEQVIDSVNDQFDRSSKIAITDQVQQIDLNINTKLEIYPSNSEHVYIKEINSNSQIDTVDGVLTITTDQANKTEFSKIKLFIPTNLEQINLTSTNDVKIINTNIDNLNVNMMDSVLEITNSEINTLTGEIFGGEYVKNNSEFKTNDLRITE